MAHDHHIHRGRHVDASWRVATLATLHCLAGCALGEVLGMVIATAANMSNGASIVLSIALAFVFGYALTMRPLVGAGLAVRRAGRVALAADTTSITVMEVMDTLFLIAVPGALAATLGDALFWWSLAASLVVAFIATVPVNRWLIARGRGHAVVHAYHG